MPSLANYPVYKQAADNSCWACAARSIANFNFGNPVTKYATDQDLAKACGFPDINTQQSAAAALAKIGIGNNTDDHPIPSAAEIKEQIEANRPLLTIVGAGDPKGVPNLKCKLGHWVVIVGISDDGKTIGVFDPDQGKVNQLPYDPATYVKGLYWENSSYVDPPQK